jgi:signal transduction histidine kinase
MRWPLRNQLLLPATYLILATLTAVSVCNAWISAHRARSRIEHELNSVATTLADASFPLTESVLQKMRGLSGAEFVVTDRSGKVMHSSSPSESFNGLVTQAGLRSQSTMALGNPVSVGKGRYFQATLDIRHTQSAAGLMTLHILYPEDSYREAWRHAVYPPLLIGAVAVLLVIVLGSVIASRVTRPLRRLQVQVDEIAHGDFRSMPIPLRDDEIADLSKSINRMSEMLARFERDVRRNEQLRTLGQLGAGIAHQIRNSVTGCRLAVDLHARECPMRDRDESLQVAMRQLELMERYVRRFMSLGRNETRQHALLDFVHVVQNVVALVAPTARHMGVELEWMTPEEPHVVSGDADALEQLMVNLSLNAIEAASQMNPVPDAESGKTSEREEAIPVRKVRITLQRHDSVVVLAVGDSGPGPSTDIQDTLFDPFVSEKRDGTGIGLTMAQEIAVAHHGKISWRRCNSKTEFAVELPVANGRSETTEQSLVADEPCVPAGQAGEGTGKSLEVRL